MARTKKVNPAEKASDLQRRGRELIQQSEVQEVVAILKKHPRAAAKCLEHLEALGFKNGEAGVSYWSSGVNWRALVGFVNVFYDGFGAKQTST